MMILLRKIKMLFITNLLLIESNYQATEALSKPGVDPSSFVKMFVGLLGVLALIFILAWLSKKMNLVKTLNSGHKIKNLATLSLGAREKVSLIEVGGIQILLGVTANSVNKLHLFNEPLEIEETEINQKFSQHFKQAMNNTISGEKQ